MNGLKLRLILWLLGSKMRKAAKTNPKFIDKIKDKEFVYQIKAGSYAKSFLIKDNGLEVSGAAELPDCTMNFADAGTAVKVLTATKPEVFMHAIQDNKLKVEGDFSLVQWFQSAAKTAMKG